MHALVTARPRTATVHDAVRALASVCDGARVDDHRGFSGRDAGFGHSLAGQAHLTVRQEAAAHRMLRKYRRQLATLGIDYDALIQEHGEEVTSKRQVVPPPARFITYADDAFQLRFPYSPELVEAVRQIPDRRWQKEGKFWSAPVQRCLEVWRFADAHGFVLDDVAKRTILANSDAARRERERVAEVIRASSAQDADIELPVEGLRPFQRAGVAYCLERRRTWLADDPGLGKTVQALTTLEAGDGYPALVVCPKSVLSSWRAEVQKWVAHRTVATLSGTTPYAGALAYSPDLVLINYDVLAHWAKLLIGFGFRALVLDESHMVKSRKSKRTKAAGAIAKSLVGEDPFILCLSGTPLINRPAELITQLSIMRRLDDLGGFRFYWKHFCGEDQYGAQHLNELNIKLRRATMCRRLKKDVLSELPARQWANVPVELTNRSEYDAAERNFLAWLAATDPERVSSAERAEALARLAALRGLAAKGKLRAMLDWIEDFLTEGQKLIVFAHHRAQQQALLKALAPHNPRAIFAEHSDRQRGEAIKDFQSDESVRVIVCSLKAANLGITLTAASNAAFLELDWSPAYMLQALDRAHRLGQRDSVTGWRFLAPDSIDDYMSRLLERKQAVLDEVLDGRAAADAEDQSVLADVLDIYQRRAYTQTTEEGR